MKKSLLYILLAVTVLAGCDKNDGPVPVTLARVPGVLVNMDPTSDKFISPVNPAGFKAKLILDLVFPNEKPQSVDLVVMRNKNPADVKVVKTGVTSFPTPLEVTGQQLIDLFGQPITGGANFIFGANINLADGQTIIAFPTADAVPYGSGALNVIANVKPGSTTQVQFLMPCAFDPNMYAGDFVVVKDDWQDTSPGDIITFTKIDATHFSFIYPTAVNPIPIIVTVDPATNTPSIASQTIGTAWTYSTKTPAPTAKTTTSANNLVDPCSKTISLNMTWTDGPNSYANNLFSLKKK